ncbi:MAG: metallophosphoesterase [Alicyclobacillus herbarius]|uniref:metallophosphoesterase family protein n=1 Tax=Alicyclobacillus herbarius TaxID=122960 RepID=UPI00235431AA|nr:metallophosphoesterase [Alicyclobacillus herbarius]MCL6632152.1 metallophosphoesterase [Alicyclobacillus herbarius]
MDGPEVSFAVFSDLHFMAWKETLSPVEWVPQVNGCLEDAHQQQPDFVVLNGDLTNGKQRDYDLAFAAIRNTFSCPVYCTMGNHEYYGYYEPEDYAPESYSLKAAQQRFLRYSGMPNIYYSVEQSGCVFLFLSCEAYTPDLKDAGWLSEAQLAWLQERLADPPSGPVFIFLHQPLNQTVAESHDTLIQSDALQAILRTHPQTLVFTGHTHCRMDRADQFVQQDGVWYVGGGCPHGEHPQYRFVEVYRDRVVLRLRDCTRKAWIRTYEYTLSLPNLTCQSAHVGGERT